jgi:hypothetical protein
VIAQSTTAEILQPYVDCISGIPPNFSHARALMHEHGMVQFAQVDRIHLDHGYCLDDNARAFLAAILALHLDPNLSDARLVAEASLTFCERCRRPDGRYHNLMDEHGDFTDEVGSPESFGRTMWACGIGARSAPQPSWRERCTHLLTSGMSRLGELNAIRAKAYGILGLAAALDPEKASPLPPLVDLPEKLGRQITEALYCEADDLASSFRRNAEAAWEWWEPTLTWGNARLPEAMIRAGAALSEPRFSEAGMRSLTFLASITQPDSKFIPIGNAGWHDRGKTRAIHDQQPIEACSMVDVWLAASKSTGRREYLCKALEVFGWFFGMNTERIALVSAKGGCCDGLAPGVTNANMGAESTLSYLQAHAALALALKPTG